uniref:Uncharacterized protein n=1 Tax=Lepeophtheirus salmonis TaxID=72036 RepID=A0A0K2URZ2_LEPSM
MHIKHRVHLFSERNCNVCLVPIIIEKVDSQKQVDVERRIIRTVGSIIINYSVRFKSKIYIIFLQNKHD